MGAVETGIKLDSQIAANWGFIPSPAEVYEPIYQAMSGEMRIYDGQLGLVITRKKHRRGDIQSVRLNRYLYVLRAPFSLRSGSLVTLVTDKFYGYDDSDPHIEYRRFGNLHPTHLPVQALGSYLQIDGVRYEQPPLEIIFGDTNLYEWAKKNNQKEPLLEMQLGLNELRFFP